MPPRSDTPTDFPRRHFPDYFDDDSSEADEMFESSDESSPSPEVLETHRKTKRPKLPRARRVVTDVSILVVSLIFRDKAN